MKLPAVASRVDREAGYREEAGFFEIDGSLMFAVTSVPVSPARTGVIICSSILIEHMTNYRREVVLARALATRGMAVQRFHYHGTGHSSGDESRLTQDLLVQDALAVVKHFVERTEVSRLAFVGSRWGALVAAMAAANTPESPLVLVEPVVDTDRYFRELGRARRVIDLRETADEGEPGEAQPVVVAGPGPTTSMEQEFGKQGWADTLGWMLYERLYTSGSGKRLDEVLRDRTGPVLLVQLDHEERLKPEFAELKKSLVHSNQFDVRLIIDEPGWLFPGSEMRAVDPLAEITAQWLSDHSGVPAER